MDLSTLPLMPSMDLPPPVDSPVPTAQRPTCPAPAPNWRPAEQAADGCWCPSCQELRERDRTASSMRQQQYGSVAVPPTPAIREGGRFDISATSEFGEQEFRTVTGRSVDRAQLYAAAYGAASQPAMASIPPPAPPMQSPSRIRGRYTRDTDVNGMLAGGECWLDPAGGCLYDNPTVVGSVNSGMTPRMDGTWASASGRVWEAT